MSTSAPARLDPVGRLRLPRRTTTLRAVLVAALLLTAAGVLYAGTGTPPPASACPGTSAPASPRPASPTPAAFDPQARLPIPDGRVGVPVPVGDPASLAVLLPGDVVDLLAVPPPDGRGSPAPLAAGVPVLAVDRGAAALLLGLTPDQGQQVVSTPPTSSFAVIVHP